MCERSITESEENRIRIVPLDDGQRPRQEQVFGCQQSEVNSRKWQ